MSFNNFAKIYKKAFSKRLKFTKFYFLFVTGHVLEFVVEPSDTVVEAGRSAVLDCVVKAAPEYPASVQTIQWLDQDRQPLTFIADPYR